MRFSVNNYYATLSSAITDLNTNSFAGALLDPVGAKVQVIRGCDGTYTVRLLDSLSENATIEVNKNIVLDLNGKALAFTAAGACLTFGAGTNCVINGKDGSIIKDLEGETTDASFLIRADGSSLKVNGGTYFCHCDTSSQTMVFRGGEGSGNLTLESCAITAENNVSQAKSIQSQAAVTDVVNCTVTANGQGVAYGVFAAGHTTVKGSTITATSVDQYVTGIRSMGGQMEIINSNLSATCENGYVNTVYSSEGEISVEKSSVNAASASNYSYAVTLTGGTARIADAVVYAISNTDYSRGISLNAGNATVIDSTLRAVTNSDDDDFAVGINISPEATLTANNTAVLADAKGDSALGGPLSIAISNHGTAYLVDVTVNATHSGVENHGKLYVFGGDYTSFCHGGFYLGGDAECEAYINDAIIRGGHYYEDGLLDATALAGDKYGCLYIGGGTTANNITAYLDGCTFDASDCHRSIIIRGSSGEQNNTINISNSTVMIGTLNEDAIRIDNATHKLNVGIGTNINTDSLKNKYLYPDEDGGFPQQPADYEADGVVEYTNQLYRRMPDSHICNGKDYQAIYQWMKMYNTAQ